MAGVDVNKLRTYQLIVRFVDINDADTQFRCVIELSKFRKILLILGLKENLSKSFTTLGSFLI